MRKSNIIIKKVRNLMILSMAVIVIISVYFNILNSRAKETTDIVANVTDETGEVDSQKVTLVATGNKNGNYEISLPETISNVYVSNYKTLNGDKSANDKIVLSQDEVENKEINLEVNYDKKNVTSTKTNEEMTLYKQNLEYDDKGIYVEGYMPLLAQINVIQNENDISLEILYTVVESNNMSTKEIYVPSEYEQTLKITLNKKKYGVEQSLISSTDAEYIVVEQSDSKLVINNISSNTIDITNEEVPTIISSQYNGEDNKYYFAGGPIANSQIESIKFVTNPKEVLGTKWDASENGDNSVIAGYIDSNGNELYEIYVASNSDKTTKVYTPEDASYMFYECSNLTTIDIQNNGQSPVKIVYIIKNITIMGKTYNIKDDINAEKGKDYIILGNPSIIDERYGQDILNNETLLNNPNILEGIDNSLIVDNEYTHVPFYLTIDKTERLLTGERGTVNLAINWPAEDENIENKDLLDSTWGHSFAKYMKYCQENNIPLESTISVNMQLIATQDIDGENT